MPKAIGDDADFSRPDTMQVIERFLEKCSEAVSKRNNRLAFLHFSWKWIYYSLKTI